MAYTRVQLRDLIRQQLGWSATDTFVTDAELNNYIAGSLAELHSLLATAYRPGQWGLATAVVSTIAGVPALALGVADFGRLLSVRMTYANELVPILSFDVTIDPMTTLQKSWTPDSFRYALSHAGESASSLVFDSAPAAVYSLLITYVRCAPSLSADGQSSWMGWDDYVIFDCVAKCLRKEEADDRPSVAAKEAFAARIRAQAEPLDLGQAATVQDLRGREENTGAPGYGWFHR